MAIKTTRPAATDFDPSQTDSNCENTVEQILSAMQTIAIAVDYACDRMRSLIEFHGYRSWKFDRAAQPDLSDFGVGKIAEIAIKEDKAKNQKELCFVVFQQQGKKFLSPRKMPPAAVALVYRALHDDEKISKTFDEYVEGFKDARPAGKINNP